MNVWSVASVDDQPKLRISSWSIRQAFYNDRLSSRHLVGWNEDDQDGRVSSKIVEINLLENIVKTESGRIYLLVGPSGYNSEADYVWNIWCKINKVVSWLPWKLPEKEN